jgi:hypothetical protein
MACLTGREEGIARHSSPVQQGHEHLDERYEVAYITLYDGNGQARCVATPPCEIHTVYVRRILQGGVSIRAQ